MKQKNQSGFGIVEIILLLLALLLVGFIAWYVISANNKDATAPAATNTPTNDAQQSGATKYLEIKEWGIKFSLTVDTADAYYDNKTSSTLDSMSLRSHALDSEPDCTTAPQSVASIFRVAKDAPDETIEGKKYSETQDGKTIGEYFYFIQSSQYLCTDKPDKQQLLQGIRNSFNTAGPSIEKI